MNWPSVLVLHLQVVDHLFPKQALGIAALSPLEFEALGSSSSALQSGRDRGQRPGAGQQGRAEGTGTNLVHCLNLQTDTAQRVLFKTCTSGDLQGWAIWPVYGAELEMCKLQQI